MKGEPIVVMETFVRLNVNYQNSIFYSLDAKMSLLGLEEVAQCSSLCYQYHAMPTSSTTTTITTTTTTTTTATTTIQLLLLLLLHYFC